jgi:two-component system OmpR family sensor kinase
LLKHESRAFWKFFSIYFGSVAFLILASGFFYFEEQKKTMIEKEHFSMIEYTRKLKMKEETQTEHIRHESKDIVIENFNMDNFTIKEDSFEKYMPLSWVGGYILVVKDKTHYHEKLSSIKFYIICVQIFLLMLFATISYFLAITALKPMQDAITKLDNFSKDLIHDLNTPVTSILLNIKLLTSKEEFQDNKALSRIKRSAEDIGELHNNLTVLLHEEGMLITKESLFEIVEEVVSTHKRLYENIKFYVEYRDFQADINREAFKQVMTNIVSNACKYNKQEGFIRIYKEDNALCIEDGGVGIKNPQNVFERSYKEHKSGHGIGLDIVKRLCDAMQIKIEISSELGVGTKIFLRF